MRTSRPIPSTRGLGLALRRTGSVIRESLLLAAAITLVEAAGPFAAHDGADLIVVIGAALLVALLTQAGRIGWLPASAHVVSRTWLRLKAAALRLAPRYAVAFRPSPGAEVLPDRTLAAPRLWLLGLLVALTAGGPYLFDGLLLLREHVAYTIYLIALAAVWSVLFFAVVFGCIAAAQWLHAVARRRGGSALPFAAFTAFWVAGLVGLSFLPGWVALGVVLVAGWLSGRALLRMPPQVYLFCRRDVQGRSRTIPVHLYLQQVHTVIVLALAVVIVLGNTSRLWFAEWPSTPFAFTSWLGLLASLCALLLIARTGTHFRRIVGGGSVTPEVPLTPTLWIKRPPIRDEADEEAQREAYWHRVARDDGWLVLPEMDTPRHAYDLVLGDEANPRAFRPREAFDEEDARFQLARRFHVVHRRRFHRSFERLFKSLRAETPAEGTGYLFCPHVWLVPGVVRDVDHRELTSNPTYGPPYARAFDSRTRRYIGSVLRDLQVDLIYWEDAISWKDIRRVLTIAYEIHDQRRSPLLDRHFQGLPRVRVVIQEEAADADGPQIVPTDKASSLPEPASGYARILLILRDRGERDDADVLDPADYGVRTPTLVG
ncbi:MAG: hypothetical protein QNJ90_00170 [Planctomycetota bacterium]|nr:hypothetical protein [Planctomycetota bacterium]